MINPVQQMARDKNVQAAGTPFGSAGGQGSLGGKSFQYWIDRLGVSEADLQEMINNIVQSIGTQTAQSQNRISGLNAMTDASPAAAAARMRGADIRGNMATVQGINAANQYASSANRQAWAQIMGADLQETYAKQNEKKWYDPILGGVGTMAGVYTGTKLAGR